MIGEPPAACGRGAPGAMAAGDWTELIPLILRVARLDATALIRVRRRLDRISALAILPSGALVGRTLPIASGVPVDWTARAADLEQWLGRGGVEGGDRADPRSVDGAWNRAIPPERGWQRVDAVPASVVRRLVDQGAAAHRAALDREAGARAARDLLEAPVLTVTSATWSASLSNRELAAIVSMAFLPDDGEIVVSRNGRWTRAAARFGSAFAEDPSGGLLVL